MHSRWQLLVKLAAVLVLKAEKLQTSTVNTDTDNEKQIQKAIDERQEAKLNKDFAKADQIRDDLLASFGIQLIDKPGGKTDWIHL